jgi:hypothetical protein
MLSLDEPSPDKVVKWLRATAQRLMIRSQNYPRRLAHFEKVRHAVL